jgi:hypothetical protein
MQFKWLVIFALLLGAAYGRHKTFSAGKQSDSKEENFVLVGASSSSPILKFEDEKLRSSYYYPMMIAKPHDYSVQQSHHHHSSTPATSLLNLNLGLLEPFMLVTFLIFVIQLIEKAKILNIARQELEQYHHDFEPNNPDSYYIKRNSTV